MHRRLSLALLVFLFSSVLIAKQTATVLLTLVVSNPHYMDLTWTDSSTSGVTYSVLRGPSSGSESQTPVQTGITELEYMDENVVAGNTYCYEVEAVDASGTASAVSNEACGKIPTP